MESPRGRPPVFDPDALRAVAHAVDPEFAREIAGVYLLQLDELTVGVETALRDDDDERGRRAAHNLKASSGQVGAVGLAALCRRIELGEGGDAEDVITELKDLARATRNALEAGWDAPSQL